MGPNEKSPGFLATFTFRAHPGPNNFLTLLPSIYENLDTLKYNNLLFIFTSFIQFF